MEPEPFCKNHLRINNPQTGIHEPQHFHYLKVNNLIPLFVYLYLYLHLDLRSISALCFSPFLLVPKYSIYHPSIYHLFWPLYIIFSSPILSSSYHQLEDFLIRSQIDCFDPNLPGPSQTFDLKTRATVPIRTDVLNVEKSSMYKLNKLIGTWNSFEREFMDLIRAGFLKFNFQVRLGKMHGIFVAYHNTKQLFGFEYVPLAEIDTYLFGSHEFGERCFDYSLKLCRALLGKITENYPNEDLRLTFCAEWQRKEMDIFVERLQSGNKTNSRPLRISTALTGNGRVGATTRLENNPIHLYRMRLETFVNGRRVDGALMLEERDNVDVYSQIQEDLVTDPATLLGMYEEMLKRTALYNDVEAA